MSPTRLDPATAAYVAWTEHRFYRYRGCAPDPDNPRQAAGNPDLSLDAWMGEDRDGAEPPAVREAREAAAIDVCFGCAVMVQCDRYANSVVREGGKERLAEPAGIRGGRTALERHKAFIKVRVEAVPAAAPDRMFRTAQKQAVLRALARCWGPLEVAVLAELPDVRTANWQRSDLVGLLGLPKDVSRMRVLEVARERGLLEGVEVVPDDGTVRAVPRGVENWLLEVRGQGLLWPSRAAEVRASERARRGRGRGVRASSLRVKFRRVEGQEGLDVGDGLGGALGVLEGLADVRDLFPAGCLEAVA